MENDEPPKEAEEGLPNSAGTLTVAFTRGQNQYGNDRFAYGFTTTDIQKDFSTIKRYSRIFDAVIDAQIKKRTDIKNSMPGRKPGRPRKTPMPVVEEPSASTTK
jgi:hypothetical protein